MWIKIKLFLTSKKYFFFKNQPKYPQKFGNSKYTLKNQNKGTGICILQLFHAEMTHCWPVYPSKSLD